MIVNCPSCSARYKLDDSKVTGRGAKITCPRCRHVFVVYPENRTAPPPTGEVVAPVGTKKRRSADNLNFRDVGITSWKVRVKIGLVYDFGDVKTLRKYLQDGRVTPEDAISHDGDAWITIGEIDDLDAHFIAVYEDAEATMKEREAFDDEDPTTIIGMGTLGSNLAAQALKRVSEPDDDLAAAMASAAADPDGHGRRGGSSTSKLGRGSVGSTVAPPATPPTNSGGPVFADPFAAMRDKQKRQRQRSSENAHSAARRTGGRSTSNGSRPTTPPLEKSRSRLPLFVGMLLLLGGASAWYITQNGTPPTSAASNVSAKPKKHQAPAGFKSITEKVEESLEAVEPIPLAPLEYDAEPELRVVVPDEAVIRRLEQQAGGSGGTSSYTPPPPPPPLSGDGVVSSSNNSPGDNYQIGQTFARQGKWSQAVQAFGSAAQGEPSNAEYQCAYGESLFHSGQHNTAVGPLMHATSVPRAHKYLGYIAQGNGDTAGARGYWQTYLGYNPGDAAQIQAELDRLN